MYTFQYYPDVVTRFPNTVGGVIIARGLHNAATPPALQEEYLAQQQRTIKQLADTPLSQVSSLSAWRSVFSAFGVEPTKYRSAAEALLRRLTKKGDIPSINTLVDLGNLVSIRYALPVAVFDGREVKESLTVHFADGSERFKPLGETVTEHPEVGEVVFSDVSKMVTARRWCWRQSEESAAQNSTTDAIITVEAQHQNGRADVESALNDLLELLHKYSGGDFSSNILDSKNQVFSA